MVNGLRANAAIRRRYQFWVYSYPSGYPFPFSASLLRKELDDVARVYPDHKPIVLVGHSMGGMVSRLLVTDAGDRIWLDYFGAPPEQTPNLGASKQILEDALVFNHRRDIQRVIFISTPHRGSNLATFWAGRLMASLVKPPKILAELRAKAPSVVRIDPAAVRLNRIPNGIDTLSPKSRFVLEMNKFPIAPGIPYHSIMGDRGRGDTPSSSDGVVPYWSSHLEGAQSELIVPSHHGAHETPQAIAEVARILQINAQVVAAK
jgi:pimeloyl-ACP methyl ester carboxylesterase